MTPRVTSHPTPGTTSPVVRSRRWPVHPQPGPLESLSSWTARLARLYGMQVGELLGHNLGLVDLEVPALLDWDPPAVMLAALAERTGVELARVRATTLAGWVPWLVDSLTVEKHRTQEVLDTYVGENPVLLEPGAAPGHQVHRWRGWRGVWLSGPILNRVCPLCASDPERGTALVWSLPLMIGCAEHGCRLENGGDVDLALFLGRPPPVVPVTEPVATMDRYTYDALTTGEVALPGRTVHAGVWFRLLRSLLHELSLATTTLNQHGRTTLERVWQVVGGLPRAGLKMWCPFEALEWSTQETLLSTAATALDLAAHRQIEAHGVFGPALAPAPYRRVYEGDRPPPDATALMAEVLAQARRDPDVARQLLTLLTFNCPTLARFDEERIYLSSMGVPPEFLPTAGEFGRLDLLVSGS